MELDKESTGRRELKMASEVRNQKGKEAAARVLRAAAAAPNYYLKGLH